MAPVGNKIIKIKNIHREILQYIILIIVVKNSSPLRASFIVTPARKYTNPREFGTLLKYSTYTVEKFALFLVMKHLHNPRRCFSHYPCNNSQSDTIQNVINRCFSMWIYSSVIIPKLRKSTNKNYFKIKSYNIQQCTSNYSISTYIYIYITTSQMRQCVKFEQCFSRIIMS